MLCARDGGKFNLKFGSPTRRAVTAGVTGSKNFLKLRRRAPGSTFTYPMKSIHALSSGLRIRMSCQAKECLYRYT